MCDRFLKTLKAKPLTTKGAKDAKIERENLTADERR
jgi:hypothetical protein